MLSLAAACLKPHASGPDFLAETLDRMRRVVRIGLVATKLRQDPSLPTKRELLAEASRLWPDGTDARRSVPHGHLVSCWTAGTEL